MYYVSLFQGEFDLRKGEFNSQKVVNLWRKKVNTIYKKGRVNSECKNLRVSR